jgi:hypothetical protein
VYKLAVRAAFLSIAVVSAACAPQPRPSPVRPAITTSPAPDPVAVSPPVSPAPSAAPTVNCDPEPSPDSRFVPDPQPITIIPPPLGPTRATIGAIEVSGGEIANMERVVTAMRRRFRRCYAAVLEKIPELAGSVELVVHVDEAGAPVCVNGTSQALAPVVPCLKAVAASGAWDPPGTATRVVIPVTLEVDTRAGR